MDFKKVLLVDDEEGIRRFLGLSLEDLGYEVQVAVNGRDALEVFQSFKPSIILTDIKMPIMDGIELLRNLKRLSPDTEVLIITGHGDLELAIEALKHGAADFITKPINADVLEISLKRVREKLQMKRQLLDYTENLERLVEEKSRRIVELERETTACRVVEGLSTALADAAGDMARGPGVLNELPCLVSVHNRECRIVVGNDLFMERLGEFIGKESSAIYAIRHDDHLSGPIGRTFATGLGQRSEENLKSSGGEIIPVTSYTAPIRNSQGEIDLVLDISVDMTKLTRLKEELLSTQLKYQRLFDEAPCYIAVYNTDHSLAEMNRRLTEDFGPDRDNLDIDKRLGSRSGGSLVGKTLQDGGSHHSETVLTTGNGASMNVLVWSAPVRNLAGEIIQVMEMATDITEIRRLQDHLTSLGIMLGSMSHGVKGMLTALDGGIYRLESGLRKQEEQRVTQAVETLKSMIHRIKKMVLDILYYAKSRDLETEDVDMSEFLRETAEIVRGKAESAGMIYTIEISPDLGILSIDGPALAAALVNLLENAVDACEAKQDKDHRINFQATRNAEGLHIVVADTGMGMDRETREKIFTLFFSSKGRKGTGLGLFIANQAIEQHGGSIVVESQIGIGSRFIITLPVSPRQSSPASVLDLDATRA